MLSRNCHRPAGAVTSAAVVAGTTAGLDAERLSLLSGEQLVDPTTATIEESASASGLASVGSSRAGGEPSLSRRGDTFRMCLPGGVFSLSAAVGLSGGDGPQAGASAPAAAGSVAGAATSASKD